MLNKNKVLNKIEYTINQVLEYFKCKVPEFVTNILLLNSGRMQKSCVDRVKRGNYRKRLFPP